MTTEKTPKSSPLCKIELIDDWSTTDNLLTSESKALFAQVAHLFNLDLNSNTYEVREREWMCNGAQCIDICTWKAFDDDNEMGAIFHNKQLILFNVNQHLEEPRPGVCPTKIYECLEKFQDERQK